MRIALVAQDGSPLKPMIRDPYGAARTTAVTSLAHGLARLGHRVTVYARADSGGLPGSVILAKGVTVEHLTAGPATALTAGELTGHVKEFSARLAKRWQRNRPDIVHACSWTSGLAALAAARGLDIPVVQSFGSLGLAERRHGLPATGPGNRVQLETCVARNADVVLAATSADATELIRMGVPRRSVKIVPGGVDTDRFCPEGPGVERGERPRLLAVAPLEAGQHLDVLIRMLPAIPEAELVIAGGPPRSQLRKDEVYRELMRLARSLGVQRRLMFAGQVSPDELPALLRSADLLVSAAPYDPDGLITIAAMACGTPVAVSAAGANRDAVVDETTGLLVAPGRPDLLARRIRRLLATPMRLEAFGIAAADRASARYGWDRIARETLTGYAHCLPEAAAELAAAQDDADLPDQAIAEIADLPRQAAADLTAALA
jgi:glycosyltransferase involved in cell wall biosynthesis